MVTQVYPIDALVQWSSTLGMHGHLKGYAKTSYINQNETEELLEP
jgi:hypothetical protein